jgi:hypothetical protein
VQVELGTFSSAIDDGFHEKQRRDPIEVCILSFVYISFDLKISSATSSETIFHKDENRNLNVFLGGLCS